MILAVPLDGDRRPVCSEMRPGTDVTTVIPVIDRLRRRFDIAAKDAADRASIIPHWSGNSQRATKRWVKQRACRSSAACLCSFHSSDQRHDQNRAWRHEPSPSERRRLTALHPLES
jgi:hypothetical protein